MVIYKAKSDYSIQDAFAKVDKIVVKAGGLGFKAVCLADNHTVSGIPEFLIETKKFNKKAEKKLKPLIGCDLTLEVEGGFGRLLVICRDLNGWRGLLAILANSKNGQDGPYASLDDVLQYKDSLLAIVGGLGSIDPNLLVDKWPKATLFGTIENHGVTEEEAINRRVQDAVKNTISGNAVYYVEKEDQLYQQIHICSKHKIKLKEKDRLLADPINKLFFEQNESYIKDPTYYNADKILDLIADFSIERPPQIPSIGVADANEYITELAREGWKLRQLHEKTKDNPTLRDAYINRIKKELDVFKKYNLSNYMLVIRDCMQFCRDSGVSAGLRGSASGCLLSYFIGISDIDPVLPDPTLVYDPARELVFERFINEGRFTEGNVSLPDIDLDCPISFRAKLIDYVIKKYGHDCVSYIVTFGRMDGRAAIKEVFRVLEPVAYYNEIADEITKNMLDKAKVQDDLQDMQEDNPDYTIVDYNIDNVKRVAELAQEFPNEFAIAKKLANTIKSRGRHAAGVVIANEPLANFLPIIKEEELSMNIAGVEMEFIESFGGVKYDFLGLACLEKIDVISRMINIGSLSPEVGDVDIGHE